MGFGLIIGFIEGLQLLTTRTSNYNTFIDLCTLRIFSVCYAFTGRCLVAASNNATQDSNLRLLNVDFRLVTQDSWLTTNFSLT
jgi:hypothetical protein